MHRKDSAQRLVENLSFVERDRIVAAALRYVAYADWFESRVTFPTPQDQNDAFAEIETLLRDSCQSAIRTNRAPIMEDLSRSIGFSCGFSSHVLVT